MKVQTTRFGELEIGEEHIILIPEGILGFPESHRFVMLEHDSEGTPFKWLQSADNPGLAFIVMDPTQAVAEYEVVFDAETAEFFGASGMSEQFVLMAIVNVPRENPIAMTLNARAPIVVHADKRIGRQIILANEAYQIRHRLFTEGA